MHLIIYRYMSILYLSIYSIYIHSLFIPKVTLSLSALQHHKDEIGEVFQDEQNMAAILMRRHIETGDLIMVS